MDIRVKLAKNALETFVKNRVILDENAAIAALLSEKASCFVTIYKNNRLRGCIGTISPMQKNLALEIIHNAIASGTEDPRFMSVQITELEQLVYSVDVLKAPEKISSINELDIKKYGVIVRGKYGRTGLLLPNLEGVDSIEEQVEIAKEKAGLRMGDFYTLERFEVIRYK